MLYEGVNILTLDSDFNGRTYKKELTKEINNFISKIKSHTKHIDSIDPDNFIGVTTGYELFTSDGEYGGYCDGWSKEIVLNEDHLYHLPTIIHECAHSFQFNTGIIDLSDKTLSYEVKLEQQCETIGYLIYKELFKIDAPHLFTSYFDNDSIIFLKEWYGNNRQCDLIL